MPSELLGDCNGHRAWARGLAPGRQHRTPLGTSQGGARTQGIRLSGAPSPNRTWRREMALDETDHIQPWEVWAHEENPG